MSQRIYNTATSLISLAQRARLADTDGMPKAEHNHAIMLVEEAKRNVATALTIITGREVKP